MNPEIEKLTRIISEAQDIINAIRVACPHKSYEVGRWSWAPGHFNTSRICLSCRSVVPGITKEEVKAFHEKN